MSKLNIVFVTPEAAPLAKTGGLADVTGSLPHAIRRLGHRVTVFMPFYRRHVEAAGFTPKPAGRIEDIRIDGTSRSANLHQIDIDGLRFMLVEQDDLYDRDGLYGTAAGDHPDNPLRYTFFCRVVLEATGRFPRPIDVFHCHDWQTGLLPLLLKRQYQYKPKIASAACIYTIHNLAYQGIFDASWIPRLGLPMEDFHPEGYEFYGRINCMKAGIAGTDRITTVSRTYAEEILTPTFGCQLEGFLERHVDRLSGIVNGLDTGTWNPADDRHIAATYAPGNMRGKAACKQQLQQELGFAQDSECPLLAAVTRLVEQKGVDLITHCIPAWLEAGYQIALLGTGDPRHETLLRKLADNHPEQMHFYCGFNEALAHRFYAGADLFLMPSRFEPCGLGQLIAMRYGTIPIVRATGGLRDTVVDYTASKSASTGFHFREATPKALDKAVDHAVETIRHPAAWNRLVGRAMRRDSSWDASAADYLQLYSTAMI
ncbi:MAG TPA: glycogen synthase GlgA [Mariprofundaceae bacterium]|nr:glycogen synthase GlgA [Mariprofundaceae bacterium]